MCHSSILLRSTKLCDKLVRSISIILSSSNSVKVNPFIFYPPCLFDYGCYLVAQYGVIKLKKRKKTNFLYIYKNLCKTHISCQGWVIADSLVNQVVKKRLTRPLLEYIWYNIICIFFNIQFLMNICVSSEEEFLARNVHHK